MQQQLCFENEAVRIDIVGQEAVFWTYTVKSSGRVYPVSSPIFEIAGQALPCVLNNIREVRPARKLTNGCYEYTFAGSCEQDADLSLELTFRLPLANPVVRYMYTLQSRTQHTLTKTTGRDQLRYQALSLQQVPDVLEVRFAEFVELVHSYCLAEYPLAPKMFANETRVMGPLLCASGPNEALLTAYEHGSQVPDAYLQYHLHADRLVELWAHKGNYYHGQTLDEWRPYHTLWLQFAAIEGSQEQLAEIYRTFVLEHQSIHAESRKPYIFYNTWNYQERNRWWYGNPYLEAMHEERMLQEIDRAHEMGIEVFVIDTGWYSKTGDYQVNTARFPNHLRTIKERLDSYGMKLGLWFDPVAAAMSSSAYLDYQQCEKSWHGKPPTPHPVWETEASHRMCLVSAYSDRFADELIRLAKEVGVTYFKWDAVDQYGCDDPGHWHGDMQTSAQERADCYSFQLIRQLTRIVERVSEAVPEAIVDFDVTEANRAVGLSFLSVGKYFLINNGPYYPNYDVPMDWNKQNVNLFFNPGLARGWICRTPLTYDRWLPSILFLTHHFPDDPEALQMNTVANLILGQNGIWGDLPSVSAAGVFFINALLQRYKVVRDDITQSYPVRLGGVGGSPEVHEKISTRTGCGVVVVFATAKGEYTYITERKVSTPYWHTAGLEVDFDEQSRARLHVSFAEKGVQIIFFGVA